MAAISESREGFNALREGPFTMPPYKIDENGCVVRPLDAPGIGLEVDENFIAANPLIEGAGFV